MHFEQPESLVYSDIRYGDLGQMCLDVRHVFQGQTEHSWNPSVNWRTGTDGFFLHVCLMLN